MCLVTNDEEEYDEGNEDKIDSSYGIHGFWASRKILKTATEFLGLGHVTIRAGDCVFFFTSGVNNPAILLQKDDVSAFVENVYVPGIKYHSAVLSIEDRESRVRSFVTLGQTNVQSRFSWTVRFVQQFSGLSNWL